MHGHVKLSEGETVAQGYCPLDLFSGKEPRIRAAIDALYDAWVLNKGEANNLKVFVHGQHIISSEVRPSFNVWCNQLMPVLAIQGPRKSQEPLRDRT